MSQPESDYTHAAQDRESIVFDIVLKHVHYT
jgi:hypothetical protein